MGKLSNENRRSDIENVPADYLRSTSIARVFLCLFPSATDTAKLAVFSCKGGPAFLISVQNMHAVVFVSAARADPMPVPVEVKGSISLTGNAFVLRCFDLVQLQAL